MQKGRELKEMCFAPLVVRIKLINSSRRWLTDVQLRKEKATEKLIEDGPASGDEHQEQGPLVLPDDDSSDGIGGDDSDGSGGAPNEGDAMDWGTEDWTAEPTSEGGMPASRNHPLGLWR